MSDGKGGAERLEAAVALGFSLSEAVQKVLGQSLTQWAKDRGHTQSEVSMCLLGYHQRTYPLIRDDLATSLDLTREDLDRLIDSQKPATEAAS